MELVTDWIRAAVAGLTVDGRMTTDEQLEQMGASYDREVYNARIWLEHIRGMTTDSQFNALGDVIAAKTTRIQGGTLAGKTALYVKVAPHPDLVKIVRNGQKVHVSIEMHTDFQGTGKAYLMGLGVTDSPASIGTGILKFSTERQRNLFSTPVELVQDAEATANLQADSSTECDIC